jgi:hypothetical protein
LNLLSFFFAFSAMLVPSFWSFLSQKDSATGVPAYSIDFVATPNEVFASLRKYSASSCRIKRPVPIVHNNAARSLLDSLTSSEQRCGTILALTVDDTAAAELVRPMTDEDLFDGLRLVMPIVKREGTGLSLSDSRLDTRR